MLFAWSGWAPVIAVLSIAFGVLTGFICSFVGIPRTVGDSIGVFTTGFTAYWISRREYRLGRPNTIMFLPVWCWGIFLSGMGAYILVAPPKALRAPDQREVAIRDRLRQDRASGSNVMACERAVKYREHFISLAMQDRMGSEIRVYVEVDSEDPKAVRKAAFWAEVEKLDKYGPDRKHGFCLQALQLLELDFPGAVRFAAVRGKLRWEVTGSSGPGQWPVANLGHDPPTF